jgi:UDP-N-acetylglucosamine/UDP-N-acetylgalactosamine diphosphorylase
MPTVFCTRSTVYCVHMYTCTLASGNWSGQTTTTTPMQGAVDEEAIAAELHRRYTAAGQGHVTQGLVMRGPGGSPALTPTERAAFIEQIRTIDPERVNELFRRSRDFVAPTGGVFGPLQNIANVAETEAKREHWRAIGLKEIAAGRVGTVLLAGGQGTRLGFDHPKGMYNIGLPSGRTLFELQAARIRKLQALACEAVPGADKATIYWYVMTSPATDSETRAYFEEKAFFGLERDQVFFFCQGVLPCLSDAGEIILASRHSVAMAPNGNGGLYEGLAVSGALKHMEEHGVEHVPQYCVDNALVKIADPVFVGFCAEQSADCAAKVVPKLDPHEKVGVVMLRDSEVGVVEYSELDKDMAEARHPDGRLVYSACHVCINYFSRSFLVRAAVEMVDHMPLHVAHKAIPYYDVATGAVVTPQKPNGIKLELFIFDTFPFADNFAALEIQRVRPVYHLSAPSAVRLASRVSTVNSACRQSEEFAPVKNAPGSSSDSPDTARAMVGACHQKWFTDAGGTFGEGLLVRITLLLRPLLLRCPTPPFQRGVCGVAAAGGGRVRGCARAVLRRRGSRGGGAAVPRRRAGAAARAAGGRQAMIHRHHRQVIIIIIIIIIVYRF